MNWFDYILFGLCALFFIHGIRLLAAVNEGERQDYLTAEAQRRRAEQEKERGE